MKKEKNWKSEKHKVKIRLQSEVTQDIAKSILDTGNCDLPTFNESTNDKQPTFVLDHIVTNNINVNNKAL